MPADQLALLAIVLVVIAAAAVIVAYATALATRRSIDGPAAGDPRPAGLRETTPTPTDQPTATAGGDARDGTLFVSRASTRQVARVVAFLFLASVAVVVALTGAWPDYEPAIFTLLAAGTLLVVLSMDMVPPAALGRWRRPFEGVGAILFLGLLMALTGGVESPFFVGFFLVVAGTALSTEGLAPLAIALLAAATIALVGIVVSLDAATGAQGLAWIGFNAVALILLADIATAASRSQRHARDEALRASRFDALTGLYNRAFFFTTMEQEIRRSDRMGRGFTMLMLDLDDLKPVNDTFGHQWGDRLLKAVADTIRHTIRFTDSAARYGGDEFVVLLPETDAAGGYVVGEKLRRDIAALSLHAADRDVRSSVSVGLVTYPDDGTTIEQIVAAADVAMYESKRRGKNRIVGYQTRVERVATAIDLDETDLVQLGPEEAVRTGGDPAPWAGPGRTEPIAGARRRHDPAPQTPQTPQPPESGAEGPAVEPIPIEPDSGTPIPIEPDDADEPRRSRRSPSPASTAGESASTSVEPTDRPRRADAVSDDRSRPWLTRTGDQSTSTPSDEDGDPEPPPRRSAADARGSGRYSSRSDEIRRTGERPWIALPIEPYDPPDRPRG